MLFKGVLIAFAQNNQIVLGLNNMRLHNGGKSNYIFPK